MPDVSKWINEFIAFLFFMVIFVWVIKDADQFNKVLTGFKTTYLDTFNGLTAGAGK